MTRTQSQEVLSPEEVQTATETIAKILEQMDRILPGRPDLHRLVMVGILSRGHILLEGVPGVGKTALIRALGELLTLDFKRVQFTPDLMPGDILGTHILQQNASGVREMTFQPGPVFTHILLADEINRASPKTQSALLEAMQERRVTLMGTTRPLPEPFFVLASQNPIELEGTYPLPEAQLDRFMFKLSVPHVAAEVLTDIIHSRRHGELPPADRRLSREELERLFAAVDRVFLPKPVAQYIARLVSASHPNGEEAPEKVRQYVLYGASPRAAISIAESARAWALTAGRPTVGFEDVRAVAYAAINHRVILNYKARFDQIGPAQIAEDLLQTVDEVKMNLPEGVSLAEAGDGKR